MRAALIAIGVGAGLAALAWSQRRQLGVDEQLEAELGVQLADWTSPLMSTAPLAEQLGAMTLEGNVAAFLQTIRTCEGTAGADGYRTLFGGELFAHYADHPRQAVTRTMRGKLITSTAAGAYQILARTWDEARRALGLVNFEPAAQDVAALWLIRRRGALEDVRAGRLDSAIAKCAKEWASLPGSPYGQPTKTITQARAMYVAAGGAFA